MRLTIIAALLSSSAFVIPSLASAAPQVPKYIDTIDDHSVDLVNGLPYFTLEEGGIGSGPGRVSMKRIWAEDVGFVDNWTGGMFKVTNINGSFFYVQLGGISDTFNYATGSGPYTNNKGTGSTLIKEATGKYLYTSAQGAKIEFDPTGSNSATSCPGADAGSCAIPISIIDPNGLKFLIDWQEDFSLGTDYFRLSSVKSSAGYRLVATYLTNTIGTGPNPDWFKRATVSFSNTAISSATQSQISYSYGTNTVDVTDPLLQTWRFTTDSSSRLTGIRRPGNTANNASFSYGTDGLVSSASLDGITYNYTWVPGPMGRRRTAYRTDPNLGQISVRSELSSGRPLNYTNELNHTTTFGYDIANRLNNVTFDELNYTEYLYDSRGNVTDTIVHDKARTSTYATHAAYGSVCSNQVTCNKPNTTTDANGNVTSYTYDPGHGGLMTLRPPKRSTSAVQPQTVFSYSPIASASGDTVYLLSGTSECQAQDAGTCAGTADETKTHSNYDTNLQETSSTRSDGTGALSATRTLTYDPRGNVLTVDGPLASSADTIAYKYDADDQLKGIISPDPDGAGTLPYRAIRLSYRPDGQVTMREIGTTLGQTDSNFAAMNVMQHADTTYDSASKPVLWRLSSGATVLRQTQWTYDALGRHDCTAVRMDRNQFSADAALTACTLGANTDPRDRIIRLIYDAASDVTQIKVAVGTSDEIAEQNFSYTNNGLVQTFKDGENNLTTYVYDGFDRLSLTQYPTTLPKGAGTSNSANYEQLTYDAGSNIIAVRNRAGESTSYNYDHRNSLTLKDLPGTEYDVSYRYDNLGRLTSSFQKDSGGTTIQNLVFGWDALSRNTSEGGPHGTTNFSYDLADEKTGIAYSTSGGGAALSVTYAYLLTGELKAIMQGATALANYSYDSLGNRTNLTLGNGVSQTSTFDVVSRLSSLTNTLSVQANSLTIDNIAYNPASQIVSSRHTGDAYAFTGYSNQSKAYTVNGLNQYVNISSVVPTYDLRGNLTSAGGPNYCYSSESLLLSSGSGATCASPTASLTYDPAMRLYQVAGTATTRFSYDGLNAIAEYNSANLLQRRYVFDTTSGQPVLQFEGTSTSNPRYFSSDDRGSVISITDSSGVLLNINRYDEFGMPQSTNAGRFGYTGQIWVPEVALQYSKARMYAPALGRFMQVDPVGYRSGPNLYAYTGNDSINRTDPSGKFWFLVSAGLAAGLDYGAQVAANYANGQSGYEAWSNVNTREIIVSGALGSLGGFFGPALTGSARLVPFASKFALNTGERLVLGAHGLLTAGIGIGIRSRLGFSGPIGNAYEIGRTTFYFLNNVDQSARAGYIEGFFDQAIVISGNRWRPIVDGAGNVLGYIDKVTGQTVAGPVVPGQGDSEDQSDDQKSSR